MYYNIFDKILVRKLPKCLIAQNGSIIDNFYLSDTETLANNGYYTVRSDNDQPPKPSSMEKIKDRKVIIEKPYVDIVRVWIDSSAQTPVVHLPHHNNL